MSGIVHKESLPAQGQIKRRRVDAPPATAESTKQASTDVADDLHSTEKPAAPAVPDGSAKEPAPPLASSSPTAVSKVPPRTTAQSASSSSSSSDSDDDDDSDDEIERENARLAKLREQRSRRQEQPSSGAKASTAAAADSAAAAQASGTGTGTNSYDHDVLFRNPAWRNPAAAVTAEAKRKEKWAAVLNRTQDSAAHKHFMKNYFK